MYVHMSVYIYVRMYIIVGNIHALPCAVVEPLEKNCFLASKAPAALILLV
jgi:hypothetical protein